MGNGIYPTKNYKEIQWISQNPELKDLHPEMKQLLSSDSWVIDFRDGTQTKWMKALPMIKRTDIVKLICHTMKCPTFVKMISHIQFPKLKKIRLHNLTLRSCEPLSKLDVPLLQIFEINMNPVVSVRALRKMYTPNLKQLNLIQNRFFEGDCLTEMNTASNFQSLVIFSPTNKILPESISWTFKIMPKNIANLQYYNTKIIRNKSIKDMMHQRYPSAKVILRYDSVQ